MCDKAVAERKYLINILSLLTNLVTKPDTKQREVSRKELGLESFTETHQCLSPSEEMPGGGHSIQITAQRMYDGEAAQLELVIVYCPYKEEEISKVVVKSPGLVNDEATLSDQDSLQYAQRLVDFYRQQAIFSAPIFKVFPH